VAFDKLSKLIVELYGADGEAFLKEHGTRLEAVAEGKKYYQIPLEDIEPGDVVEYWKAKSTRGRSGHGWRRVEKVHRGYKHKWVCVSRGKHLPGVDRVDFGRIIKGLRDV
jgi:hypothetical protein